MKFLVQVEDQGVDPNLRDGDGATPLHFASSRGHLTTVRWLLSHGAKLSLDKYGKSPINDAAENQQVECLNVLVQHGTTPDYGDIGKIDQQQQQPQQKKSKASKKYSSSTSLNKGGHSTSKLSKSSSGSSDSEPFYLHPPNMGHHHGSNGRMKDFPPSPAATNGNHKSRTSSESYYHAVPPNDGLFINPMRNGSVSPRSPCGSISGESFFLHDPQEVIYNRVKDLFSSSKGGGSGGGQKGGGGGGGRNVTVQAQVHSSSSGAASASDEDISGSTSSSENTPIITHLKRTNSSSSKAKLNRTDHDYEDIYLVREEAHGMVKSKIHGRSRSRDSGSHSRSASASSNRSNDVMGNVRFQSIFLFFSGKSKINFFHFRNSKRRKVCFWIKEISYMKPTMANIATIFHENRPTTTRIRLHPRDLIKHMRASAHPKIPRNEQKWLKCSRLR